MECDRCKSAEAILHITQVATDMLAQRQTSALSIASPRVRWPPLRARIAPPSPPTLVDSYPSRESSFSCDEVASPIRRSVHSRSGIPRVKLEIRELLAPSVNAS